MKLTKEINETTVVYEYDNLTHNPHKPAIIYTNGQYNGFHIYFLNGKEQNIVGPAESTKCMVDGDHGLSEYYYINGEYIG